MKVNTLMKMSQKRSYVGAVIVAANASEYFNQDIEDYNDGLSDQPTIRNLVPSKEEMARKLVQSVHQTEKKSDRMVGDLRVWYMMITTRESERMGI